MEANKTEYQLYDALKAVVDPELGLNIIDLGLVYKIAYSEEQGAGIEMTLSAPGCPMGDVILDQVRSTVEQLLPGKKFSLRLVWDPAWSADRISPQGRKMLGLDT
jgi:metal-sulfur cluster biosynthetic enzyme